MKNNLTTLLLLFIIHFSMFSQNTIGLLVNKPEAYDGYTLFTPERSNSVFLIDNCGNSIHTWTFNNVPKFTCYLLENGNLLRTGADTIEIRDWDNNLIWEYNLLTNLNLLKHHDIEPLPNGNILCIVKENISEQAQIDLGKNPTLLNGTLKSEKIIEIEPIGTNAVNIVWEWRFADHLIQDFDATKSNYGTVSTHPELVDFNYDEPNIDHSNWLHINSIDYNLELDQILFSSRTLSEIYIIDHSTTTMEAASHIGGNQNKGGDFLWRWGNPQIYRQGTVNDQKLRGQHDAKWITNTYINENKISVFNNQSDATRTFSSIHILDVDNTYPLQNASFLPANYFWSWSGEIRNETVFESKKSGVQALENGNLLLCETEKGRLSEITLAGEIVWIYRNPVGPTTYNQYDTNDQIFNNNGIFRGEKYPKTYAAFTGRDLTPGDILEDTNNLSDTCNSLDIDTFVIRKDSFSFNNPVVHNTLSFHHGLENTNIQIYNTLGKLIFKTNNFSGKELEIPNLKPGIHFLKFEKEGEIVIEKAIVK